MNYIDKMHNAFEMMGTGEFEVKDILKALPIFKEINDHARDSYLFERGAAKRECYLRRIQKENHTTEQAVLKIWVEFLQQTVSARHNLF